MGNERIWVSVFQSIEWKQVNRLTPYRIAIILMQSRYKHLYKTMFYSFSVFYIQTFFRCSNINDFRASFCWVGM